MKRRYLGLCAGCQLPVWELNGFEELPDGSLHHCGSATGHATRERPFYELPEDDREPEP